MSAHNIEPAGAPPPLTRVLATKLFVPRVRSSLVARERLTDVLESANKRRLTCVVAPPGFGKSTLAVQWIATTKRRVAWLSLSEVDNDPLACFSGIVTAVNRIAPDVSSAAYSLLAGAVPPDLKTVVTALGQDLVGIPGASTLVLDDYHAITDARVHELVSALIDLLPASVNVVLLSRSDPPLPLARLRANDDLAEIRVADLRFARSEVVEFFQSLEHLELTLREVDTLGDRTEGWAAGLHLAAVSLRSRPNSTVHEFLQDFNGSSRMIDDYLVEEVFARLPHEITDAVLSLSVLDRFNPDLVAAMIDDPVAKSLVPEFETRNLFVIPLDDQRYWYRFHHLFAEAAQAELRRRRPESISALHRRACAWLKGAGWLDEAVRHAVAAGEWQTVRDLFKPTIERDLKEDRVDVVQRSLLSMPRDEILKDPDFCYFMAFTLLRAARRTEAMPYVDVIRSLPELATNPHWSMRLLRLDALDATMSWRTGEAIRACQQLCDLTPASDHAESAIVHVTLAIALLQHRDVQRARTALDVAKLHLEYSPKEWTQIAELRNRCACLVLEGKLLEASVASREIDVVDEGKGGLFALISRIDLAEIYREWNSLPTARAMLVDALDRLERGLVRNQISRARLGLARTYFGMGELVAALDEANRAIDAARAHEAGPRVEFANALRARIWLRQGRHDLVRLWADERASPDSSDKTGVAFDQTLTLARIAISDGHPQAALDMIRSFPTQQEEANGGREAIELQVVQALAHLAAGDRHTAEGTFGRALDCGMANGFVRVYLDEGPAVLPLIRAALRNRSRADHARRLLAWSDAPGPLRSFEGGPDAESQILSERELEILRLVAEGLGNRAIGGRLFITEATVKKHVSSIIAKLGVESRTQAVAIARRARLI